MNVEAMCHNDCHSEMSQNRGLQTEEKSAQSKLMRDNIFEVKFAIGDLLYRLYNVNQEKFRS